jgi:hypothetical protein
MLSPWKEDGGEMELSEVLKLEFTSSRHHELRVGGRRELHIWEARALLRKVQEN